MTRMLGRGVERSRIARRDEARGLARGSEHGLDVRGGDEGHPHERDRQERGQRHPAGPWLAH
jgi:hypothetical protein